MTKEEYLAYINIHRDLVRAGMHPAEAARLMKCAAARVCADAGLGLTKGIRSIRPPGVPPVRLAGDRCQRIDLTEGDPALEAEIARLQSEGWNVTSISPYPGKDVYYACPPGATPMMHQPLVAQAGERF